MHQRAWLDSREHSDVAVGERFPWLDPEETVLHQEGQAKLGCQPFGGGGGGAAAAALPLLPCLAMRALPIAPPASFTRVCCCHV